MLKRLSGFGSDDAENERDYTRAERIREVLSSAPVHLNAATSGLVVSPEMHLGELVRQFDSTTTATVSGWMEHSFHVEGWGLGVQVGRLGVGVGSVQLPGHSTLAEAVESSTRQSQLGDGFIAVLESEMSGRLETVRLVVPSETLAREMMDRVLGQAAARFEIGTHSQIVLSEFAVEFWHSFQTEISYAADQLSAALRVAPERRPAVRAIGVEIRPHVILGGALELGGDSNWIQLAPVGLLSRLEAAALESYPPEGGSNAMPRPPAALPYASSSGSAFISEGARSFSVVLLNRGSSPIETIRVIRQVTQIGLKDAKDIADRAPSVVRSGLSRGEAEAIKSMLEAAGAQAQLN